MTLSHDPDDEQEEAWVHEQRKQVLAYLKTQKCIHGGLGEWPAFHVVPYFALWAIQSKKTKGRIGWWAVSGDIPTDYMSSQSGRHPREAMRYFSRLWSEIASSMERGEEHPDLQIGQKEKWSELAPLLRSRSGILKNWADDDSLWEE